jgi:hypothetical protein
MSRTSVMSVGVRDRLRAQLKRKLCRSDDIYIAV